MNADIVAFAQDRIAMAYSEQLWAVALVTAMNGFIAANAKKLLGVFKRWILVLGTITTGVLALFFIWSRHFIFEHYDGLAKAALGTATTSSLWPPDRVPEASMFLARWSGVSLYTFVVVGAAIIAVTMLIHTDGQ